jgi:prepilin-type N-terminal cleavage/methylation domain-containing protein/prepilin-type processing-associated H-X9-DG protein
MMEGRARSDGFTLVEVLVVVALVAILASLAFPVYQRVIQDGRATGCVSNLRQLGVGLGAYLVDNNNSMPILNTARANKSVNVPVIDNTLSRYVTTPGAFACPADVNGFAQSTGTSYFWNVAINGQSAANLSFLPAFQGSQNTQSPSQIPIMADKEGFHPYLANKVNVLYADGHASKDLTFFTGN